LRLEWSWLDGRHRLLLPWQDTRHSSTLDVDLDVFGRRIHLTGPHGERPRSIADWSSLSPSLRALLDDDDIRTVAAACGYDL